jgi:hypothetical protein
MRLNHYGLWTLEPCQFFLTMPLDPEYLHLKDTKTWHWEILIVNFYDALVIYRLRG